MQTKKRFKNDERIGTEETRKAFFKNKNGNTQNNETKFKKKEQTRLNNKKEMRKSEMFHDETFVVENKRKQTLRQTQRRKGVRCSKKNKCKCSTKFEDDFKTQEMNTLVFKTRFHLKKTKTF